MASADEAVQAAVRGPEAEDISEAPVVHSADLAEPERIGHGRLLQKLAHEAGLDEDEIIGSVSVDRADGVHVRGQDEGEGAAFKDFPVVGGERVSRVLRTRAKADQRVFKRMIVEGAPVRETFHASGTDDDIGLDSVRPARGTVTVPDRRPFRHA